MCYQRVAGVYQIECIPSGRVYFGQSVNIKQRWADHRRELRQGRHSNPILQASYRKYGPEAFVYNIVCECVEDALLDIEETARIETAKRELGEDVVMNIGEDIHNPMKGRKHTAEACRRMSDVGKGRKRPPRSAEWCQRISEAHKCQRHSPERIQKAALARTGLTRSQEAKDKTAAKHRGMKRSAETKALWSAQRKGRRLTLEWRANISAGSKGRVFTPEHLAKITATKAVKRAARLAALGRAS